MQLDNLRQNDLCTCSKMLRFLIKQTALLKNMDILIRTRIKRKQIKLHLMFILFVSVKAQKKVKLSFFRPTIMATIKHIKSHHDSSLCVSFWNSSNICKNMFSLWQGLNIVISGLSQQPEIICQRRATAETQEGAYRADNRRRYVSKSVQSFMFSLTPKEKKKHWVTSAMKVSLACISPNMNMLHRGKNIFR